jgi:signal transduction histidine kinase
MIKEIRLAQYELREPVSDIRRVSSDLRDEILDKGFRQWAFGKMNLAICEVRTVVWVTLMIRKKGIGSADTLMSM